MVHILLAVLCSALRISELMPDPSRVEDSRGEYVEIENPDASTFHGGWRLVAGKDTLKIASDTILPGGYRVLGKVLESDNGGFRPDFAIPSGWGLANQDGRMELLDAAGKRLDVATWTSSVSGSSLERCSDASWRNSTGTFGLGDRGTPGAPNSCDDAPRAIEGAVDSFVRVGDALRAVVRNRGLESWTARILRWREGGRDVWLDTLSVASGASVAIARKLPEGRANRSRWTVHLPRDVRPTDDSLGLWVREPAGTAVIAEIQPADAAPEWIEIAQELAEKLPLGGWSLGAGDVRGILPTDAVVPAAGRLVLSSDCAALKALLGVSTLPCAEPYPWPRLATEEDQLSLRDADGGIWDSVSWNRAQWGAWPKGKTRERQDLTPFGGAEAWLPSASDGGTPGYGPAEAPGWTDGAAAGRSFRIPSRRVRPGDAARALRMEIAGPRDEELRIDLFDMGRRQVLRIHEGVPPRGGVVVWNGQDARGRDVKPGVYVVLAEFGTRKEPAWKAKEWIVVSPSR